MFTWEEEDNGNHLYEWDSCLVFERDDIDINTTILQLLPDYEFGQSLHGKKKLMEVAIAYSTS